MVRHIVALALWTYFGWYLGALLAVFLSAPAFLGPAAALLTLAVGLYGWRRSPHQPRQLLGVGRSR